MATPSIDSTNLATQLPLILRLLELPNASNVETQTRFGVNLIETSVAVDEDNVVSITFTFDMDFSLTEEHRKRVGAQAVRLIKEAGQPVDVGLLD